MLVTIDGMHNAAIELINSEHMREGLVQDGLNDEEWRERFFARWAIQRPVSYRQLARLRELRTLLRRIVEQITAEQAVADRSLEKLNSFLEPLPIRDRVVRSAAGGLARQSVVTGHVAPSAVVALDFLRLLTDGDWRRLRVCANDTCRWAFYDESRNRIRLWCDSTLCGNVMKVRRFRERNRRKRLVATARE
jgi:predicted RNA-binding Zn ribbon-like protein